MAKIVFSIHHSLHPPPPFTTPDLPLTSLTPQVIAAEGELNASKALKEAADVINESPAALQLRYLQTLSAIAAERNSTILFPVPIEMMRAFVNK